MLNFQMVYSTILKEMEQITEKRFHYTRKKFDMLDVLVHSEKKVEIVDNDRLTSALNKLRKAVLEFERDSGLGISVK